MMKKNKTPNFGKLNNTINDILVEGILTKDNNKKALFSKYIKLIKEDEILSSQFLIYQNLKSKTVKDLIEGKLYIDENLKVIRKYKNDEIAKANNKILKLLKESGVKRLNNSNDDLLYESIHKMVLLPETATYINDRVGVYQTIQEHLLKEKPTKEKTTNPISNKVLVETLANRFNKKYPDLDSETKGLLMRVFVNGDNNETYYKERINEVIEKIDVLLKESDDNTKTELLKVKEKINEFSYSETGFVGDMVKVNNFLNKIK